MSSAFKVNHPTQTAPTAAQLQQEIEQLEQEVQKDAAQLAAAQAALAALEDEKNPDPDKVKAAKAAVAAAEAKEAGDNEQISEDEMEMAEDSTLAFDTAGLMKSILKVTQKSGETQLAAQRQADAAIASAGSNQINGTGPITEQDAAKERAATLNNVIVAAQAVVDLGEDAIARLDKITQDQKTIDTDEELIKMYKAKFAADLLKFSFTSAAEDYGQYTGLEQCVSWAKSDLATQEAALKTDLQQLFADSEGALNSEIHKLFAAIKKVINLIVNGNTNGEGDVHKMQAVLAEVMSIVQEIVTKVQSLRSKNNIWMDRVNASNEEISANKTQAAVAQMATLAECAKTLQLAMEVVKYGGMGLGLLGAAVTGGTSMVAFAALMTVLTELGVFTQATQALAKAIDHNDSIWSEAVAAVVITIACILVTHTAGPVIAKMANGAAEMANDLMATLQKVMQQAAEEAVAEEGIELQSMAQQGVQKGGAEAVAEERAAASSMKERMVQTLKEIFVDPVKNSTWQQNVALGLTYGTETNSLVNTVELSAALATHQANKSKEELEQQQLFMIIQIVTSFVQVLMAMGGMSLMSQGASESQMGANMQNLMKLIRVLQGISNIEMATSASAMVGIDYTKGLLTKDVGAATASTSVYKSLGQMSKLYDSKQIELFASKLQQMIEEVSIMIRKAGQAENAAARILEQSAV